MKITDLFSRINKASSDPEATKTARLIQPVQPVGHAGRLTLVPGQLIQGEVVGEDANGLLLLKLAGEIIAARTPMKLELGQQFWFEVKEAGDSPLLSLASQKGAIYELLKDIMATRHLLVNSQPGQSSPVSSALGAASGPPAPALPTTPPAADVPGPLPTTPQGGSGQVPPAPGVVAADGSLPPEAARLVRALVIYMNQPQGAALTPGKNGALQPPALIKTIVSLIREGQIPAALQKLEAFQGVIRPRQPFAAPLPRTEGLSPQIEKGGGGFSLSKPTVALASSQPPSPAVQEGVSSSSPAVPPASSQASTPSSQRGASQPGPVFTPETIKILNALVAVSGIKAALDGNGGALQPAMNPDRNLAEILTMLASEDKIPGPLQKLSPFLELMGITSSGSLLKSGQSQPGLPEKNGSPGPGLTTAHAMLPLQFGAAQQGGEAMPAQLRLLASLLGLGARDTALEIQQEIEEMFHRLAERDMPGEARKLASFFEAHSRLNTEAAPKGQSDFYIMPSIFSGQNGWGEWLWSREHSPGDSGAESQENLVFFLEMSNLGALTIKVILKEQKLRGQIFMADKKGSELVTALLPGLLARLEAFGYDVVDFACSWQPLNIMQELKENLYRQAGSGPVSLLDVQV